VVANRTALCQVLGNLVENAVKHNPKEGPVVRVRAEPTSEGNEVEVTVEGNGPGFPPDVVSGFAHMSTTPRGFGLAIAKRGVELMKGRMWLGETPEGGGLVHFTLPAATDGKPAPPNDAADKA
jgi:signal transduction histidine kinase